MKKIRKKSISIMVIVILACVQGCGTDKTAAEAFCHSDPLIKWINSEEAKVHSTEGDSRRYLFFTRVCGSCPEVELLTALNMLKCPPVVVLHPSNSENDVKNLKKMYDIQYPVIVAPPSTEKHWNDLMYEYSFSDLNAIYVEVGERQDLKCYNLYNEIQTSNLAGLLYELECEGKRGQ